MIVRPLAVVFKREGMEGMGFGCPAHTRERGESWATVACFSARWVHGYLYVWADAIKNKYATNE